MKVSKGWITLEGTVDWQYQRAAAENAVRYLIGVRGVSNLIEVKPQVSKVEIKAAIEAALKRSAELDANRVTVETDGDKVTLRGTVCFLGRTPGGRARCLVGARRPHGGQPYNRRRYGGGRIGCGGTNPIFINTCCDNTTLEFGSRQFKSLNRKEQKNGKSCYKRPRIQ